MFAEIAQLVEHNLAKVGVASSSLVFRSSEISLLVCLKNDGVLSESHFSYITSFYQKKRICGYETICGDHARDVCIRMDLCSGEGL